MVICRIYCDTMLVLATFDQPFFIDYHVNNDQMSFSVPSSAPLTFSPRQPSDATADHHSIIIIPSTAAPTDIILRRGNRSIVVRSIATTMIMMIVHDIAYYLKSLTMGSGGGKAIPSPCLELPQHNKKEKRGVI